MRGETKKNEKNSRCLAAQPSSVNSQLPEEIEAKYHRLKQIIQKYGRAAVACSGGVDSTLLLRAAKDSLGDDNVLALLAASPLQTAEETRNAELMISEVGCRKKKITWDPLASPEIAANPIDRCYHCKKAIYTLFWQEARKESIPTLLDGSNLDDLHDYRPGRKAVQELNVHTPLIEAGLFKEEIRRTSRYLGLSNWDRPSASCLATRVPAGCELTGELISLVEQCESHVHSLGYRGFRVRLAQDEALIEIDPGDLPRLVSGQDRESILLFFTTRGIGRISVDLRGRKG